jgi:hypothetical protein
MLTIKCSLQIQKSKHTLALSRDEVTSKQWLTEKRKHTLATSSDEVTLKRLTIK